MMRRYCIGIVALSMAALVNCVHAAAIPTVTFDESGNGTVTFGQAPTMPGFMSVDPASGLLTLTYDVQGSLGVPPVPGDILIGEPGNTSQPISDLLRFSPNGFLFVYSDLDPGETPPPPPIVSADHGLPPLTNPYQNIVGPLPETGLPGAAYNDNANGLFSYIPVPGSPGSIATGAPVEYNFTSDVPEPATLGMLGVGVLGLLARRNRKGTISLSA